MEKDIFICRVFIGVFHFQKPPRVTYQQFQLPSSSQVFLENLDIVFYLIGFKKILGKRTYIFTILLTI